MAEKKRVAVATVPRPNDPDGWVGQTNDDLDRLFTMATPATRPDTKSPAATAPAKKK